VKTLQVTALVNPDQINEALANEVQSLRRKIHSLETKLERNKASHLQLKASMDLSRARRDSVRTLARKLIEELEDAQWTDVHENCEGGL